MLILIDRYTKMIPIKISTTLPHTIYSQSIKITSSGIWYYAFLIQYCIISSVTFLMMVHVKITSNNTTQVKYICYM